MKVSFIVAYAQRTRVIGNLNEIPWHLPEDMLFFYKTTVNKHVIMGRKTYESLPKELRDRTIYILTRDKSYTVNRPNVKVFTDPEKCLMMAHLASNKDEIMIAGGAEIYRLYLPYADMIYATVVNGHYEGDATFPELPEEEWAVSGENAFASENLDLFYTRIIYERIKKTQP